MVSRFIVSSFSHTARNGFEIISLATAPQWEEVIEFLRMVTTTRNNGNIAVWRVVGFGVGQQNEMKLICQVTMTNESESGSLGGMPS